METKLDETMLGFGLTIRAHAFHFYLIEFSAAAGPVAKIESFVFLRC